ncbi:AbrB family transcriptional regulator [uncultured Pelagimonas sp.]|uniref:AbrB family transcriptional regulator n=1 Tax=uncultured Pelagimonas sp. TaxID=1618102 RepID=UPI00260719B0|nr:AbrB family transcriptional regulator [uncultured Pelagimonas sp.]
MDRDTQMNNLSKQIFTVSVASLAGWLTSKTGMPLGWMIGAMLATAALSLFKLPMQQPAAVFHVVRASVGAMLGTAFTLELLMSVPKWTTSIAGLLVAMAVMFVLAYVALRRLAHFDRPSALLCAIPGGIAEMILLSETAGADQARVSIVHALRISLTILILPVLIGLTTGLTVSSDQTTEVFTFNVPDFLWFALCVAAGFVAKRFLNVPAPLVVAPMVVSGALHISGLSDFVVPAALSNAVQVFIGINVGGRFAGVTFRALSAVFGSAVVVVAVQISVAFAAATLAAQSMGFDILTMTLAYAPGGLAEMSLIAVAIEADPAVVGLHHVFRVLVALVAAPLLLSRFAQAKDQ